MDPIAVLYENEAWMAPLFAALAHEGGPFERVFANDLVFDPAGRAPAWSLAVNKVSPSSYLRAHASSIRAARDFLPFLERRGVPVVNASRAFALETSKAQQLSLLADICQTEPGRATSGSGEGAPVQRAERACVRSESTSRVTTSGWADNCVLEAP